MGMGTGGTRKDPVLSRKEPLYTQFFMGVYEYPTPISAPNPFPILLLKNAPLVSRFSLQIDLYPNKFVVQRALFRNLSLNVYQRKRKHFFL